MFSPPGREEIQDAHTESSCVPVPAAPKEGG
jgi:hypothetical protein